MKTRNGFVSNSSSTSFLIANISDETLTLVDFVMENPQLIEEFLQEYDWHKKDPQFTQENLIESARARDMVFTPHRTQACIFGDEQGDLIGQVFDYILRNGGVSEHFKWRVDEYLR